MTTPLNAVAGALNAYVASQEVAARNLANVATPGFKRNIALIEAVAKSQAGRDGTPALTAASVDFSQGALQPTHNELDFAIQGEGFFSVLGPRGIRYTRNGSFRLNENRVLVTQRGDPVQGDSGEIQIPEGVERLVVSPSGELRMGDRVVGKLKITAFDKPEMLRQAGACEFSDEGAVPRPAATFSVRQGFIEGSNVSPISELVRMMASYRDYEASARSLKSLEESANKLYAWARS